MTRDEFSIIVKALKANYTSVNFIPDADAFNVWYVASQDLPYDMANYAALEIIKTRHDAPTVSDLRDYTQKEIDRRKYEALEQRLIANAITVQNRGLLE